MKHEQAAMLSVIDVGEWEPAPDMGPASGACNTQSTRNPSVNLLTSVFYKHGE